MIQVLLTVPTSQLLMQAATQVLRWQQTQVKAHELLTHQVMTLLDHQSRKGCQNECRRRAGEEEGGRG